MNASRSTITMVNIGCIVKTSRSSGSPGSFLVNIDIEAFDNAIGGNEVYTDHVSHDETLPDCYHNLAVEVTRLIIPLYADCLFDVRQRSKYHFSQQQNADGKVWFWLHDKHGQPVDDKKAVLVTKNLVSIAFMDHVLNKVLRALDAECVSYETSLLAG